MLVSNILIGPGLLTLGHGASCLYPNSHARVVAYVAPRAPGTFPLLVTMTVVIPEASTQPGPGHPSSKLESIGELGLKRKKQQKRQESLTRVIVLLLLSSRSFSFVLPLTHIEVRHASKDVWRQGGLRHRPPISRSRPSQPNIAALVHRPGGISSTKG